MGEPTNKLKSNWQHLIRHLIVALALIVVGLGAEGTFAQDAANLPKWYLIKTSDGSGKVIQSKTPPKVQTGFVLMSEKDIALIERFNNEIMKDEYASMSDDQMTATIAKKWGTTASNLKTKNIHYMVLTDGLRKGTIKEESANKVTEAAIKRILSQHGYSGSTVELSYQIAGEYIRKNLVKISLPMNGTPSPQAVEVGRTKAQAIRAQVKEQGFSDVGEIMFTFSGQLSDGTTATFKTVTSLEKDGFYNDAYYPTHDWYGRSPAAQSKTEWYEGGNLHGKTIGDWKAATPENRLATASDFVAKITGELSKEMSIELSACLTAFAASADKTIMNRKVAQIGFLCAIQLGYSQ